MAFPTTGVLDDFNRGNEGPPPSASWTNLQNGLEVVSNACVGDVNAANNDGYWDLTTFGADSEAYATMTDVLAGGGGGYFGAYARLKDVGAWGTTDGYFIQTNQPDDDVELYIVDNGVYTQLGNSIAQVIADGDKFGIEVVGGTLTAYYKDGAAAWGSLGTRADATYGAAGYIGLYIYDNDRGILDDFGGGTVVAVGAAGIMTTNTGYWGPTF